MPPNKEDDRVVVVGSGTAGTTMAIALARDGHHVTIIERSLEPPKRIMGELMQPGGIEALTTLGLEDCLTETGGVYFGGVTVNDCETGRHAPIPFPPGVRGISFYNYTFLKVLRQKAQQQERCTYIEGSADEVIEEDGVVKGVIFRRRGQHQKEEFRAKLTVIADGGFSRLRKVKTEDKPVKQGTVIAFTFKGSFPTSCSGPHLTGDGYLFPVFFIKDGAGVLNYIAKDTIRYSTIVSGACPSDERTFIKHQLSVMNDELRELMLACIDDVPIQRAHVFELPTRADFRPGAITLGDALNMRHPSTGAGMTIALKDVIQWRDLLRDISCLDDIDAFRAAHVTFMSKRKGYSVAINLNARAFQDILFLPDVYDYLADSIQSHHEGELLVVLSIRSSTGCHSHV